MGMEALPGEYKTPEVLHVLYCHRRRINAVKEMNARAATSPMSVQRLRELVLEITGSQLEADRAEAHGILESTRKPR